VLVFSQWEGLLEVLLQALKANDITFAKTTTARASGEILDDFKRPTGPQVLLLPLKKGAEGLNLTEATHVFLMEPVLNAAMER
jgi:E3 ubiquitin-protein ligase SHPRH